MVGIKKGVVLEIIKRYHENRTRKKTIPLCKKTCIK